MNFQAGDIRAVVLDLDGTLVDSMGRFQEIAKEVIHRHFGIGRDRAAALYKQTSGLPFFFQLKTLFGDDPRVEEAASEYESLKLKDYDDRPFHTDVVKTLPFLKQAGLKLCISSNNQIKNVRRKIASQSRYFDRVLGYRDGFLKGRAHFDFIKNEYHLKPSELLFVGDSLHDARVAFENDVPFVARLGTFSADEFNKLEIPLVMIRDFFDLTRQLGIADVGA